MSSQEPDYVNLKFYTPSKEPMEQRPRDIKNKDRSCLRCPDQWVGYRGSCYFFSRAKKDWNSSQESCSAQSSHLLVIGDAQEMELFQVIRPEPCWIGLRNRTSYGWAWEDGSTFNVRKKLRETEET
ncbi:killer cell lectin-like receptor subfamily G member 1 isoform A [Alligator mississippiensis]|uniref:Killer cell lectin-like receptor subfamily G member 1 isoform A n=1 Tax=Alligator mississippiensis TaxID=8496 RepID=A0A151NGE7_ALLMI|nr:killer cell lectin-like receptor subfamily G member 1 isoform A [Alligator mississippiensis]